MQYVIVDLADRDKFYPFSYTQSLANLRIGIYSIQERWEQYIKAECSIFTAAYLQNLYPHSAFFESKEPAIFINATCVPDEHVVAQIISLKEGEKLISTTGKWIATHTTERQFEKILLAEFPPINYENAQFINDAFDILKWHPTLIHQDFNFVHKNKSALIDGSNRVVASKNIFVEPGAQIFCANLNASTGPIYIGKDAMIMEGASIRGPFVLGEKAVVKMNTSIYGSTTVGPYCLAGGEIKNSILLGFSNKGHEGYLGDSIIGHWCNLGAGTCNSNIKNTAGKVQMWNEAKQIWETVGQKMGMLMGDYSRFAIQSSINTGSYVGVSANIFGNGLLPKYLPNFTWGIVSGYQFNKAIDDINNWKKLKGFEITAEEKEVLAYLHKKLPSHHSNF
jgi:UDP-N-acetylglucosamine diphosphorylase/glucosamine-1-phosphate N-acetyltransferase